MPIVDDISRIKKQVALYGLIVIAVCEIVSLFVLGFNALFAIFLVVGFAAALINFNLLALFLKKMLDSGNAGYSTLSFVARILIYCGVFFIAVKQGLAPGLACLLGFLAPKLPLYYFHAIKPDFNMKRKVSPEVQKMYDEMDREEEDKYWGREEE